MKRLLYALALLLLLAALVGCTVDVDNMAADSVPVQTDYPVSRAPMLTDSAETTAAPTQAPDPLAGVEMLLSEDLTATPGCPWVEFSVSFPTVSPAAQNRVCSLTLELEGELVAEWPELELEPGLEETVELEFSFTRSQPDRSAPLIATLRLEEETLVRETAVQLNNYPEEVWLSLTGGDAPYAIDVLRNQNVVIVYGLDENAEYTVPLQVWLCTTGRATPKGSYRLGVKKEWGALFGGVYGQYVSTIYGNILFHSVPYRQKAKDSLKTAEYNKLGSTASMGCIRLPCAAAKWIYDNCPTGTVVHIYDVEELPVERPEPLCIDPADPRAGWDPTDPDPENPWNAEP